MADDGVLRIKIGADIHEVTKSLAQVQKELKGFQSALGTATSPKGVSELNKQIIHTQSLIKGIKGFKELGAGLGGIAPGANQASNALMNLGRIAQDAPFGFIGISNNINPLLESFQRLKTETGTTGGALKALVSGLAGGAGLGLAVSIGTGLLAAFGDKLFSSAKGAKEARNALQELIRPIRDIQSAAVANTDVEIVKVNALVVALRDTHKTYAEKKIALEQLHNINKSYFGDLTLEDKSLQILTGRVKEYTQAIIAQARVKGLTDEFGKVASGLDIENAKLEKLTEAQKKAEKDHRSLTKELGRSPVPVLSGSLTSKVSTDAARNAVKDQQGIVQALQSQYNLLTAKIGEATAATLKFRSAETTPPGKVGKTPKSPADATLDFLKERIAQLEELKAITGRLLKKEEFELRDFKIRLIVRDTKNLGIDPQEFKLQLQRSIDAIMHAANVSAKVGIKLDENQDVNGLIKSIRDVNTSLATLGAPLQNAGLKITPPFTEAITQAEKLSAVLNNLLGPAFMGVFESIFTGGQNILKSFGEAIKQVVAKLAAAAVTAAIFAGIIALATGGTANAVKFGSQFKGLFGALSGLGGLLNPTKNAEGGITTRAHFGIVGEAGPEAIIPLSQMPGIVRSMGGGGSQIFIPDITIKGSDLRVVFRREENRWGGSFS